MGFVSNLEHCKILMVESVLYPVADGHFLGISYFLPGAPWGTGSRIWRWQRGKNLTSKLLQLRRSSHSNWWTYWRRVNWNKLGVIVQEAVEIRSMKLECKDKDLTLTYSMWKLTWSDVLIQIWMSWWLQGADTPSICNWACNALQSQIGGVPGQTVCRGVYVNNGWLSSQFGCASVFV